MSAPPFVIGQWVRGETFYGRERELAAILESSAPFAWWVGLRRIGKTSLLREAERRAPKSCLPIFWDLQGIEDDDEAALVFADALLDGEDNLETRGLDIDRLLADPDAPLEAQLEGLAAALREKGLGLLLLIDEGEALARLPCTTEILARTLANLPQARLVITTSPAADAHTFEPWLGSDEGTPSGWLAALRPAEAEALWHQRQQPETRRPAFAAASAARAHEICGGHPMLLQMLGRRCHQVGDLDTAFAQLTAGRSLDHLLAVDFDLLTEIEQQQLEALAGEGSLDAVSPRLPALGLLRPGAGGPSEEPPTTGGWHLPEGAATNGWHLSGSGRTSGWHLSGSGAPTSGWHLDNAHLDNDPTNGWHLGNAFLAAWLRRRLTD